MKYTGEIILKKDKLKSPDIPQAKVNENVLEDKNRDKILEELKNSVSNDKFSEVSISEKVMPKVEVTSPKKTVDKILGRDSMTIGKQLQKFSNGNLFSSAYSFPRGIELDGQEKKEKIVLIFRSHPITYLPRVFNSIWIILINVIGVLFFDYITEQFRVPVTATMVFLCLIALTNLVNTFVHWFYNVNIITTERFVDVDFLGIEYHKVSEAQIEKIEDISVVTAGMWSSLFNYGTIVIQTAGESRVFEFTDIPEPGRIQDVLRDLAELKQKGGTL